MENRNTAQVPAGPFGFVLVHPWIYRLEKGTEEGEFHQWPNYAILVLEILDWKTMRS